MRLVSQVLPNSLSEGLGQLSADALANLLASHAARACLPSAAGRRRRRMPLALQYKATQAVEAAHTCVRANCRVVGALRSGLSLAQSGMLIILTLSS